MGGNIIETESEGLMRAGANQGSARIGAKVVSLTIGSDVTSIGKNALADNAVHRYLPYVVRTDTSEIA